MLLNEMLLNGNVRQQNEFDQYCKVENLNSEHLRQEMETHRQLNAKGIFKTIVRAINRGTRQEETKRKDDETVETLISST